MAFKATDGLPTQAIPANTVGQVVWLNTNGQPNIAVLNDSDGIVFYRFVQSPPVDQASIDAAADIPLPPGAYGTLDRGNANYIVVRAKTGTLGGTVYATYGVE